MRKPFIGRLRGNKIIALMNGLLRAKIKTVFGAGNKIFFSANGIVFQVDITGAEQLTAGPGIVIEDVDVDGEVVTQIRAGGYESAVSEVHGDYLKVGSLFVARPPLQRCSMASRVISVNGSTVSLTFTYTTTGSMAFQARTAAATGYLTTTENILPNYNTGTDNINFIPLLTPINVSNDAGTGTVECAYLEIQSRDWTTVF